MLQLLDLGNNTLDGEIKINFTELVRLQFLGLPSSNRLHGSIPVTLSYCKALKTLDLAANNLYGQIPSSFRNLQALYHVSLSRNHLSIISETLLALQGCPNLRTLVLTRSYQGEKIPEDEMQGFKSLRVLVIANCALEGSIPLWLRNCKDLSLLDLSWNQLTGAIPLWMGELDNLFYLDLSNNSLAGEIPLSLTQLKSLVSEIPQDDMSSDEFPLLTRRNQTIEERYKGYSRFPPTIDLSSNMLNGFIWKEFGNLKFLHALDLSKNNLSGPIPAELSGMLNLEKMDLSFNNLSGEIPQSLVRLTFLSFFSVSHNCLQGPIPTGGQFFSFPFTSFEGNPGLCGEYFFFCNSTASSSSHPDHETMMQENEGSIIGLPFVIGAIVGFVAVIIPHLIRWNR